MSAAGLQVFKFFKFFNFWVVSRSPTSVTQPGLRAGANRAARLQVFNFFNFFNLCSLTVASGSSRL
jgi:predicted LPLAT superfamily acyltransferase